jgi:hypothetical protein
VQVVVLAFFVVLGFLAARRFEDRLEHDPEKWKPVFG